MPPAAHLIVHSSQFPEQVRRDLIESLRRRRVNHKFHYDSVKQTQKWLALHAAYSPSRVDARTAALYDRGFDAVARQRLPKCVHVVGLGSGGGRKDTRLLRRLRRRGSIVSYTPCDVSAAMVLVARQTALSVVKDEQCRPLVCDLAAARDLTGVFGRLIPPDAARLFTFFGMIPNFEPGLILRRLAALVGPEDYLLLSANLAPGSNYDRGMRRILPQYDNPLTREWLMTFLLDLGVERKDGELQFEIQSDPAASGLKRVVTEFRFSRSLELRVHTRRFRFRPGERIRLFFSYRHTPARLRKLLRRHGLRVLRQWISRSGEEGVFLLRRAGARVDGKGGAPARANGLHFTSRSMPSRSRVLPSSRLS
jgi:L-histidine N-alpha-methyltransferase